MYDQMYFVPAPSPAVREKPTKSTNIRVHNVDSMEQYFDRHDLDTCQLVKAVIYPTGGHKQQYVWIRGTPQRASVNPWPEDLDLRDWFPNGAHTVRLSCIPGLQVPLRQSLRLVVSPFESGGPINNAIQRQFGMRWRGNLLVLKHGRCDQLAIVDIDSDDLQVIDLMVRSWLALWGFTA